MRDYHWCKHCSTEYIVEIPDRLTGDAIIECECGWKHPRQFVDGVAVSCDPPRGWDYTLIVKSLDQRPVDLDSRPRWR